MRRAWSIIEKVADDTDWGAIVAHRRSDLLVDLALLKLNRRPNFTALPLQTRCDIKALCGNYKAATSAADELLYSAGDLELIQRSASESQYGKVLPTAFYFHKATLELLSPALRVYEGCPRWLVGDVEHANIIKLATDKPKVSYLSYPTFDKNPHPSLTQATYVKLRELDVDSRSYVDSDNPPILHRKEAFVSHDYPGYWKFVRLTEQEERLGLLGSDTHLMVIATDGSRASTNWG